jgi:hypothetical protein
VALFVDCPVSPNLVRVSLNLVRSGCLSHRIWSRSELRIVVVAFNVVRARCLSH